MNRNGMGGWARALGMRKPVVLAVLGLPWLVGCAAFSTATGTGPASSAASPAGLLVSPELRWQSEPAEGLAADWAQVSDPGLDGLLRQAAAANRDVIQAALRIQQADTQARLGGLRLLPSASLGRSDGRSLDPPPGLPPQAVTTTSVSTSVGASYELDLWGRIAALRRADAAQLRSAQTDLHAAHLLLRSRVAESYWQLAASRRQIELAQQQVALNLDLLAATRLRVREGRLLPIEIDRAAATLQQTQVRLSDLQADAALQRLQLGLLLDQPPPGPQPATSAWPGDLPPRWRLGADPAVVLERRPDVQRARAQVDAALARLQAVQAQRYPTLTFRGTLGTSGSATADWLSNPLGSLAASLVVPMIDWRRLDLQRDSARTELDLAALALRDAVARALVEVESALLEGDRLEQQLQANRTRLQEAQAAERLAALRLEVGTIARTDFLQARNARLEVEQVRLQLQLRSWLNRSQLARVLALG